MLLCILGEKNLIKVTKKIVFKLYFGTEILPRQNMIIRNSKNFLEDVSFFTKLVNRDSMLRSPRYWLPLCYKYKPLSSFFDFRSQRQLIHKIPIKIITCIVYEHEVDAVIATI